MNIHVFYFSPVGNTEKIAVHLGQTMAHSLNQPVELHPFTLPQQREQPLTCPEGDIAILATPVYAGRVPNILLKFLQTMDMKGALCVPVVVFGNRSFDDALMESALLLEQAGGHVIGGGGFAAQHSFSNTLGLGRPNAEDYLAIEAMAKALVAKVESGELDTPTLPGNNPVGPYYTPRDRHGKGIDIRKVTPKTNDACNQCGICVANCPMGSIDPNDVTKMTGICIKCCACEKKCPEHARYFDDAGYIYHREELEDLYAAPAKLAWFA